MRFLDFHTHPYIEKTENIKKYPVAADAGYVRQRTQLEAIGIFAAAGSVIARIEGDELTKMRRENEIAMEIYAEHPEHLKVSSYVCRVTETRVVLDAEI